MILPKPGKAPGRAQVPDLTCHDLRHEVVSRLVEAGQSNQKLSAISHHKTMQMPNPALAFPARRTWRPMRRAIVSLRKNFHVLLLP